MFKIHPSVQIHPTARIAVDEGWIGAGTVIRENVVIEGRRVEIGREGFINKGAWIGGGSCHDPGAALRAGDFLHLGWNSHINIARPVTLGDEVGVGVESKIFTHGAYLSAWEGFPVQWGGVTIGDRVWLPNAWINPGVTIGSDVVTMARSLITADLPSGCYAGGAPAEVKRPSLFPIAVPAKRKEALFRAIFAEAMAIAGEERRWHTVAPCVFELDNGARFAIDERRLTGHADRFSEILRNQLRRYGIRFRYEVVDAAYRPWQAEATG